MDFDLKKFFFIKHFLKFKLGKSEIISSLKLKNFNFSDFQISNNLIKILEKKYFLIFLNVQNFHLGFLILMKFFIELLKI